MSVHLSSDTEKRKIAREKTEKAHHIETEVQSHNNRKASRIMSLRLFLILCIFRVLNTFLIQSYFDPDEFWQTMEPAYCSVFRRDDGFACPGFTWEWKRRHDDVDPTTSSSSTSSSILSQSLLGPARTFLSVLPTHMFYRVLQGLDLDSIFLVARGPMFLYAITVAAPCDWAVWYSAKIMYASSSSLIPSWCLFACLVSWFNAYSMVRTFANAQEALLFILSICLVSPELLVDDKDDSQQAKADGTTHRSLWRARAAFFLGGMNVSIRGTSVAAYVPMGILLAIQQQESTWVKTAQYLFSVCALYGLLGIGVAVAVDYCFFGFVTMPFLGNFHFNVVLNYASLFGAHPWHWYLTAGTPAVAGILLPFLLLDLVAPQGRRWSKGRRNLWMIAVTYLAAMSTNAHKEFRYILPLLPVFCLLTGEQLQQYLGTRSRRCLGWFALAVIVVANLIAVLYLGLFHQSGPVTVNREILRLTTSISNASSTTSTVRRIDYWTGACHSTPLLSALHTPLIRFETTTLDCSPSCRADPNVLCETDQFHQNPLGFLQSVYHDPQSCSNMGDTDEADKICQTKDTLSSFVVTMSNYVDEIKDFLGELGLSEVARYPNNLSGAKIAGYVLGDDFSNPSHGHVQISDYLEISIEEVVLFAHTSLQ